MNICTYTRTHTFDATAFVFIGIRLGLTSFSLGLDWWCSANHRCCCHYCLLARFWCDHKWAMRAYIFESMPMCAYTRIRYMRLVQCGLSFSGFCQTKLRVVFCIPNEMPKPNITTIDTICTIAATDAAGVSPRPQNHSYWFLSICALVCVSASVQIKWWANLIPLIRE